MTSTRQRTRSSSYNLGQLMLAIGTAASLFALVSTVRTLKGKDDLYLIVGCIISYSFYLGFLLLISAAYFTRTQLLILFASTAALAALLIQAVATASGSMALTAVLLLPAMPFVLGGVMFRYRGARLEDFEGVAGESETLATLVRNKRSRGLTPQGGSTSGPGQFPDSPQRGLRWQHVLAVVVIAALLLGTFVVLRRHSANLALAARHTREEERSTDEAMRILEPFENLDPLDPMSEEQRQLIIRKRAEAAVWMRKAEWHGRKRDQYEGRWW